MVRTHVKHQTHGSPQVLFKDLKKLNDGDGASREERKNEDATAKDRMKSTGLVMVQT